MTFARVFAVYVVIYIAALCAGGLDLMGAAQSTTTSLALFPNASSALSPSFASPLVRYAPLIELLYKLALLPMLLVALSHLTRTIAAVASSALWFDDCAELALASIGGALLMQACGNLHYWLWYWCGMCGAEWRNQHFFDLHTLFAGPAGLVELVLLAKMARVIASYCGRVSSDG